MHPVAAAALLLIAAAVLQAQGPRSHTRPTPNRSTTVSESQANELTLTLTAVAVRPIQVWVRTAGTIDEGGKTITATLSAREGQRIRVGQRVRAFPPESRSSMYQAWVRRVVPEGASVRVTVDLSATGREGSTHYVLEIVTEDGDYLSVPNEAIIETGATRLVYVQETQGKYAPRRIESGRQGELYTEVRGGLKPGEHVVTFGSFFIDAEHRLKGS